MGLAAWLGFKPKTVNSLPYTLSPQGFVGDMIPLGASLDANLRRMSVDQLWRTQPHLRTVVGFVSRNVAQLGLQVFERDADDGRNRIRTGPLFDLLRMPNADVTQFELIEATVASRMLYDETYWYVGQDAASPSGWFIRHIPTPWVRGTIASGAFAVQGYRVSPPWVVAASAIEISADDMIVFRGWNPIDPRRGVSPYTLKIVGGNV